MRLTPSSPPGRSTRKARAFEAEIRLLRTQGYTFEAIRQALADAGVRVSKSTVQRECARHAQVPAPGAAALRQVVRTPAPAQAIVGADLGVAADGAALGLDSRRSKDVAQAFVRSHITNPLLRRQEPR